MLITWHNEICPKCQSQFAPSASSDVLKMPLQDKRLDMLQYALQEAVKQMNVDEISSLASQLRNTAEQIGMERAAEVSATQENKACVNASPQNRMVKKRELAAMIGVSDRTVDNWVAQRLIPYLAITPRLHLFDPVAVKKALSNRFQVESRL